MQDERRDGDETGKTGGWFCQAASINLRQRDDANTHEEMSWWCLYPLSVLYSTLGCVPSGNKTRTDSPNSIRERANLFMYSGK